jgi:GTP cyclohydrolase I
MAVKAILKLSGEDPNRDGLKDTPSRVAKMYQELFSSIGKEPPEMTTFINEGYDEMICETDIHFSSVCEHHLLPFIGKVHIAYLPKKKIVGLSKLARVVDYYSHKPQVQERMTQEIMDYLHKTLQPHGLIVMVEAEHLCMSIRGIKKPRHNTVTTALKGSIDKNEFLKTLQFTRKAYIT